MILPEQLGMGRDSATMNDAHLNVRQGSSMQKESRGRLRELVLKCVQSRSLARVVDINRHIMYSVARSNEFIFVWKCQHLNRQPMVER